MPAQWYVLNIKPHKERSVYQLLQVKEVETYFPTIHVKPTNPRASRIRPYFPGYMFVRVDLDDEGNNALRWLPGTVGLVRFGGEPASVPENLIHELKKRLAVLETGNGQDANQLQKGDRVRIVRGPFQGYEAIFDTRLSGKDRVQVLLAFLNSRPQRMKLNLDDIEKVD